MGESILKMKNICKSFPGVKALANVDFDLSAGEVHVLIGENGAGKSTLMKILGGLYQPDSGEVILGGEPVSIRSPSDALRHGISMIYQELNPIAYMTVAENIFVGREPKLYKLGFLDKKRLNDDADQLLKRLGMDFPAKRMMEDLSVAETQMIEIAKAVSYRSRIIIMDEPTSAISEREIDKLFDFIRLLKSEGVGIVYISHKLDEIYRISDRITVLRDGSYVGNYRTQEIDKDRLISLMVGREIETIFPEKQSEIGEALFEVKDLSKKSLFSGLSLKLHAGEILGISGLMGAGRTEAIETMFGIRKADTGEFYINGRKVAIKSPKDAIAHGISFLSEDRKGVGLNLKGSVRENISFLRLKKLSVLGFIRRRKETSETQDWMKTLQIKTPSQEQCVNYLSGGNQQKVVIAKWLTIEPQIIIMDEPTRGIDVGAKSEIYSIITKLARQGKGIILVSSELPEIIGMCDRVLVMHEGAITGELAREDLSQETIMQYATGYKKNEGAGL